MENGPVEEKGNRLDELDDWKERYESADSDPRELFKQVSHIAIYLSYDLIDKLRYWEKETLKLTDEQVEERLPHLATFLDRLKAAYVDFSDVDEL